MSKQNRIDAARQMARAIDAVCPRGYVEFYIRGGYEIDITDVQAEDPDRIRELDTQASALWAECCDEDGLTLLVEYRRDEDGAKHMTLQHVHMLAWYEV